MNRPTSLTRGEGHGVAIATIGRESEARAKVVVVMG